MSSAERPPTRPTLRVVRGGEPSPEEMAAIAASLEIFGAPPVPEPESVVPASSEWALIGRLRNIEWQPMTQRWPGEAPGESWRRALD